MSFRRIPFQFSTTDPVERQRELEKRFGLPSRNKMYVDNVNPLSMGSSFKDSGACSSPRLQHRVPIFVEGYDQPNRSSVDSTSSVSENKKPVVRVIPIEIEGAETVPSTRHRTFSGPASFAKEHKEESVPLRDDPSPLKRSMQDLTKPTKMKATTGPKVYNIPIKVEGSDSVKNNSAKTPVKVKSPVQNIHPSVNGCDELNHIKETESAPEKTSEPEICEEQKVEMSINDSLKKIKSILEELKSYESGVKEFSGSGKDKQYRYLDEMLTRCMLRLDDIETMGNEKVRFARKNAVKQVQACIDMLEEKINSLKEIEKVSVKENAVQDENIVQEEANLKKCEEAADVLFEVSELSDHNDKSEVSDVEITDIANSVTKDSKSIESTQLIKAESCPDASLCVGEIKTSEKLENSNANVGMPSDVAEVNDVEMVDVSVNSEPKAKPAGRGEEIKSVMSQEDSCNLSEIKMQKKQDDSKVNMPGEVEMKEAILPDINSENYLEMEMSECPKLSCSDHSEEYPEKTVESSVLQESDVELKEIKITLNEIKDRTVNSDIKELQTIPNMETEVTRTGTSAAGQCETRSDCQDNKSSHEQSNTIEVVHEH